MAPENGQKSIGPDPPIGMPAAELGSNDSAPRLLDQHERAKLRGRGDGTALLPWRDKRAWRLGNVQAEVLAQRALKPPRYESCFQG